MDVVVRLNKLDFIKAFHAVPLEQQDQPYYSFVGPEDEFYCYQNFTRYIKILPMGCKNSPALFSEFMQKFLEVFYPEYKENIMSYQDDVAVAMNTPEETISLAKKIIKQMDLSGLATNYEKSFLNPTESKTLLGGVWSPNKLSQKNENLLQLQRSWDNWKLSRNLTDYKKYTGKLSSLENFPHWKTFLTGKLASLENFPHWKTGLTGKLASLENFPGLTAELAAAEKRKTPEEEKEIILKKISTTPPEEWKTSNQTRLYVDAADGDYGAVLETTAGKIIKTYAARSTNF
eukprot:GHVP01035442.1.p1 GENE.GHVP01035442.1~~GHVP01035442.1.p1  ORF type:complete len:289 (-),score=43.03 GHVP01035442.1:295-1161(-)